MTPDDLALARALVILCLAVPICGGMVALAFWLMREED